MLKKLRNDDLIRPSADERPDYPMGSLWPRERIGFSRPGFVLLQRLRHRTRLFLDVVFRQSRGL